MAVKKTGSAIAQKSAARLAAVQVLYQMRMNNEEAASALADYLGHRNGREIDGAQLVTADADLLSDIVRGVQERWIDIDGMVTAALAAGKRTAVEPLLDCILRAGCYELLAHGSVDAGIIINDYLNVTTSFYDQPEANLVNAILDKIGKTLRG